MGELSELFFSSTPDTIAEGCARAGANGDYVCLICGRRADAGRVYKIGEDFYEARRSIHEHIAADHGSILDFLLGLDKRLTGVTEQQRELIRMFACGESDKRIASALGIAGSTVRNHRFALRERARQAKVFLGIISLMEKGEPAGAELVGVRRSATMVDERYAVTSSEKEEILGRYFDGRRLIEFPTKQKRKLVVLDRIAESFEPGRRYSEKEVSEIIMEHFDDYASIRRYLIEYGFMDREPGGKAYWIKE